MFFLDRTRYNSQLNGSIAYLMFRGTKHIPSVAAAPPSVATAYDTYPTRSLEKYR